MSLTPYLDEDMAHLCQPYRLFRRHHGAQHVLMEVKATVVPITVANRVHYEQEDDVQYDFSQHTVGFGFLVSSRLCIFQIFSAQRLYGFPLSICNQTKSTSNRSWSPGGIELYALIFISGEIFV